LYKRSRHKRTNAVANTNSDLKMNIFILSLIHCEIAMFMMDKHISKILLEAAQMLCSAKRILSPNDPINNKLYKLAHKNHPVTIWCRKSKENFIWTLDLIEALHNEWRFRYGHSSTTFHKSYLMGMILKENIPSDDAFEEKGLTEFALAMPVKYKSKDPVESYRNYYMSEEKQKIASWNKGREKPSWYRIKRQKQFTIRITNFIRDTSVSVSSNSYRK
jgi:hypothetical protein